VPPSPTRKGEAAWEGRLGKGWVGKEGRVALPIGTLGPAVQEGMEKYKELSLGWGVKTLLFPL